SMAGLLAGAVAICAGAAMMHPIFAFITGLIAGLIMTFTQGLMEYKLHIDDPAVCVPVHAACGMWGLIAAGLFGTTFLGGHPLLATSTVEAWISQIGIQAVGGLSIIAWTGATGFALFWAINKAGLLRAGKDAELFGLDIADHKTYAYPEDMMGQDFP
ncbi:MAG TPA: hypothetical protein VMX17_04795, partial [Candidatus Glassbacteria bacterium]|nr:hypothetical protein [Candidatus Glassbacteria bacterium]